MATQGGVSEVLAINVVIDPGAGDGRHLFEASTWSMPVVEVSPGLDKSAEGALYTSLGHRPRLHSPKMLKG